MKKITASIICILLALYESAGQIKTLRQEMEPEVINARSVAKGNNEFAFELFAKLNSNKERKNIFLSPFSISSALAMTYAGAKGETEKQMSSTMHFSLNQQQVHQGFKILQDELKTKNKSSLQINTTNALWAQKNYPFLESFTQLAKNYYGSGVRFVDYIHEKEREQARIEINKWVEKETNEKIKDLIRPGMLNEHTKLVLTNAIYFKGKWENEFDKMATTNYDFHLANKTIAPAPFMNQTAQVKYLENNILQAIELPYEGNTVSMIILLPKPTTKLDKFEKLLNYQNYVTWASALRSEEVILSIPKFKMTSEFSLKKVLSDMGMPLAFSGEADFSGMSTTSRLAIAQVIHKAFVEVNEEGTEAAAATAVLMTDSAVPKINIFKADRPFIFLIKDNTNGSILFMGRVLDPTKSE